MVEYKGELPPELNKSECAHDGCKLFDDCETLKIWKNNFKGIRYEDKQGNILFGAVDNILAKGKKMIVLDIKQEDLHLRRIRQTTIKIN